jgi:SHS2 domain-containing protein
MPYQILSHTADTGVEATAASCAQLINELATGMFALIGHVDPCPSGHTVEIEVEAPTLDDLIVEVLAELLYESEVNDLLLCGFETTLVGPTRVRIAANGVPYADVEVVGPPIKAVTYHGVEVENQADQWYAKVFFDV